MKNDKVPMKEICIGDGDNGRVSLRFTMTDPLHRWAVGILRATGRSKSNFVANVLNYYFAALKGTVCIGGATNNIPESVNIEGDNGRIPLYFNLADPLHQWALGTLRTTNRGKSTLISNAISYYCKAIINSDGKEAPAQKDAMPDNLKRNDVAVALAPEANYQLPPKESGEDSNNSDGNDTDLEDMDFDWLSSFR